MTRLHDVVSFYGLLGDLSRGVGGPRQLVDCTGGSGWPAKGVYFFFEEGEERTTSGTGPRVVRVGTHGLIAKANTSLWQRLSAHQGFMAGESAGGGNHRSSVFRLHVGAAVLAHDGEIHATWGKGSSAPRAVRLAEHPIELRVSRHIRAMPFLWLDVTGGFDDGCAARARIEANTIALLSNRGLAAEAAIDAPSADWLGSHSRSADVRGSGLWNVRHVGDRYAPAFLDELQALIERCYGLQEPYEP